MVPSDSRLPLPLDGLFLEQIEMQKVGEDIFLFFVLDPKVS